MHASHGDVHLGNMLLFNDSTLFFEFGESSANAAQDACEQDHNMLNNVMKHA